MIKKCIVAGCKDGEFDYDMSDISLIRNTKPPEAEIEGICNKCGAYIHVKFKAYQAEITEFDDIMTEKGGKKYKFVGQNIEKS